MIDHICDHSSNVQSLHYDPQAQTLDVKFKTGGHYRYKHVSKMVFEHLKGCASVGSAFHKVIKAGGFAFERIDQPKGEKK
jgi:hypothetical protein